MGGGKEADSVKLKGIIKSMVPPLALQIYRRLREGAPSEPEWEVVPGGWLANKELGWDHPSISEVQRGKWFKFCELIQKPRPLAVSHESPEPHGDDVLSHNALMSYGYVLALAAGGGKQVSMLDWGCGAGHYFPLSQQLLPGVTLDYTGYDRGHLISLARELNQGAAFFEQPDLCFQRRYDLVLSSSSLQYVVEWKVGIRQLAAATGRYLFITRLPVVLDTPPFVVVQRVKPYGYDTEYCGWVFNRMEVINEVLQDGLTFEREFLMLDRPQVKGACEQVQYRGYLFRKSDAT